MIPFLFLIFFSCEEIHNLKMPVFLFRHFHLFRIKKDIIFTLPKMEDAAQLEPGKL